MDDLQRIIVKVFAEQGQDIDPYEFMGVLQRWIREHTVPGTLIDVADYKHIHQGIGVILVAHEFNVNVDYVDGRMGLEYRRKQPLEGTLEQHVETILNDLMSMARQLESEPEFQNRLKFSGTELQITANDRLLAPNEDTAVHALQPALESAVKSVLGNITLTRTPNDPRERLTFHHRRVVVPPQGANRSGQKLRRSTTPSPSLRGDGP